MSQQRGAPDMEAFDRAEFDELLREVVALREWKVAQEAANFGGAPTGPSAREMENVERALYEASHDRDLWQREHRRLREAARLLLAECAIGSPSLGAVERLRAALSSGTEEK